MPKPVQERLEELFSFVNHAYSVLSNPNSRKLYDEEIWANERFGKKNLDDLAALIQTTPEIPIPKTAPSKSPVRPSTQSPGSNKSAPRSGESSIPPKHTQEKPKEQPPADEPKVVEKEKPKWVLTNEEGLELLKAGKNE